MNKQDCDFLISADIIITQDRNRRIINNGMLAIKDGLILEIGQSADIEGRCQGGQRLDLRQSLIMPGLINAHTHAPMTILRGFADDLPLMQWLNDHIFPVEKRLSPEIVKIGALLGCAEMIRTGSTAFADTYLLERSVMEAADESGLRAVAGEAIFGFPSPAYKDFEAGLELVRQLYHDYKNNPRVKAGLGPHAVYTTSAEILTRCFELAEELDCPYMIHLAETRTETAICQEKFGKKPVRYLESLGLLTPRTLLAHCVDVDEADIAAIAGGKASVVHNPQSNMKLASGIAPVVKMLEAKINVALGTDGACSNNQLNMFAAMSLAALSQKAAQLDPTVMKAQSALDLATINGAVALGQPELGVLEKNRPADLIALDLSYPNLQPIYHPVSHMVYAASGHETRLTMVAGKILYLEGRFTTIDYPLLQKEIKKIGAWALSK